MKSLSGLAALTVLVFPGLAGCRAQQPWPLWEAYCQRFLDGQGRVIDRGAADRTTSEGEAYALFFSLVDNDRSHFDKIVNWTEANLAAGDLTVRLPAWNWGRNSAGEWRVLDEHPASDADLWMAYSLMEAGRLWHDPRYEKLGRIMAVRIAKEDVVLVPGLGTTLAPGPIGFHPDPGTWVLNPSYMPLPLLAYFAKTMPDGPWAQVMESLPMIVGGPLSHGFAMDWITVGKEGIHPSGPPAEPTSGVREPRSSGSYDAIRNYLWVGIADPATPGARAMLAQLAGMGAYLRSAVTPPLEVDAEGKVVHAEAPPGFSAAVTPYLEAAGMKAAAKVQQDRLAATRDATMGLYGHSGNYYDQDLALFSTGWSDQRYRFERDGRLRVKWR